MLPSPQFVLLSSPISIILFPSVVLILWWRRVVGGCIFPSTPKLVAAWRYGAPRSVCGGSVSPASSLYCTTVLDETTKVIVSVSSSYIGMSGISTVSIGIRVSVAVSPAGQLGAAYNWGIVVALSAPAGPPHTSDITQTLSRQ